MLKTFISPMLILMLLVGGSVTAQTIQTLGTLSINDVAGSAYGQPLINDTGHIMFIRYDRLEGTQAYLWKGSGDAKIMPGVGPWQGGNRSEFISFNNQDRFAMSRENGYNGSDQWLGDETGLLKNLVTQTPVQMRGSVICMNNSGAYIRVEDKYGSGETHDVYKGSFGGDETLNFTSSDYRQTRTLVQISDSGIIAQAKSTSDGLITDGGGNTMNNARAKWKLLNSGDVVYESVQPKGLLLSTALNNKAITPNILPPGYSPSMTWTASCSGYVAYTYNYGTNSDIYLTSAFGGPTYNLTKGAYSKIPCFSINNLGQVAFVSEWINDGQTCTSLNICTPGAEITQQTTVKAMASIAAWNGSIANKPFNISVTGNGISGIYSYIALGQSDGSIALGLLPQQAMTIKINAPPFLQRTVQLTPSGTEQTVPISLLSGDADGNGQINLFDYVELDIHFNSNEPLADVDGSGTVNLFDYVVLDQHFGAQAD
ncbi:MAG: hypothetical protein ACYC1M_07365 [Armatimonadota bacterium]